MVLEAGQEEGSFLPLFVFSRLSSTGFAFGRRGLAWNGIGMTGSSSGMRRLCYMLPLAFSDVYRERMIENVQYSKQVITQS